MIDHIFGEILPLLLHFLCQFEEPLLVAAVSGTLLLVDSAL